MQSTGLLRKLTSPAAATQNEVQNLIVTGNSGTFQLGFNGGTTAVLPFNVAPSGRFFQAGNEIQQITNQNGNLNGAFRINFRLTPTSPVISTGNIFRSPPPRSPTIRAASRPSSTAPSRPR